MNSFVSFVSTVNSSSKGRDVVPSIRFPSYVEVILCKFRMLRKESLIS